MPPESLNSHYLQLLPVRDTASADSDCVAAEYELPAKTRVFTLSVAVGTIHVWAAGLH